MKFFIRVFLIFAFAGILSATGSVHAIGGVVTDGADTCKTHVVDVDSEGSDTVGVEFEEVDGGTAVVLKRIGGVVLNIGISIVIFTAIKKLFGYCDDGIQKCFTGTAAVMVPRAIVSRIIGLIAGKMHFSVSIALNLFVLYMINHFI